jgi:hypothetical protein
MVAGGAALLIDMGQALGYSTDPKVIKAVLLNSADKLAGWSNSPTHPLDYAQGAGQMNLRSAYRQYLSGPLAPGAVPGIGWDRHQSAFGTEDLYDLNVDLPAGVVITATLTWDRIVSTNTEDINKVVYTLDHLSDLNLGLYQAGNPGAPVAESVSTTDNVEHVYYLLTEPGRYTLGVQRATAGGPETYGLTWRVTPAAGLDLPGDTNLDGLVDFSDYQQLERNFDSSQAIWMQGDFNGDGTVDFTDYQILETHFGRTAPEPGTLGLLLAATALLRRRRLPGRVSSRERPGEERARRGLRPALDAVSAAT